MVGLRYPSADSPGACSETRAPSVPVRTYHRIRFGSVNLPDSTPAGWPSFHDSSCGSASLHDDERRVVEGPVSNENRSLGGNDGPRGLDPPLPLALRARVAGMQRYAKLSIALPMYRSQLCLVGGRNRKSFKGGRTVRQAAAPHSFQSNRGGAFPADAPQRMRAVHPRSPSPRADTPCACSEVGPSSSTHACLFTDYEAGLCVGLRTSCRRSAPSNLP